MRVRLPAQGEIETDKVITGIEALKGLTELEIGGVRVYGKKINKKMLWRNVSFFER